MRHFVRSTFLLSSLAAVTACGGTHDQAESGEHPAETLLAQEVAAPAATTIVGLYGKCLTVKDGVSQNGQPVVLSDCIPGLASQSWTFLPSGQVKGLGGRCLNVSGGTGEDGSLVVLYACSASPLANEVWTAQSDDRLTGMMDKCLDVEGGSHANGTATILWPCTGGINQRWSKPASLYKVRVNAIAVSDDDGGRAPTVTPAQFKTWIDATNKIYARAGIQLVFDPEADWTTLRSTLANDIENAIPKDQSANLAPANTEVAYHRGRLPILLVHGDLGRDANGVPIKMGGGMSTGPEDPSYAFVAFQNYYGAGAWTSFAHEVGHYLGLPHTHGAGYTRQAAADALGSTCDTTPFDGDGIDDTPPDPADTMWGGGAGCGGPMTIPGTNGSCSYTFDPDVQNMMSYWGNCQPSIRSITPGQIRRMRQALLHPARFHLVKEALPAPVKDITAGATEDGRLQLYAVGTDGRLSAKWKDSTDPNAPFHEWEQIDTLTVTSRMGTMNNVDGRPQLLLSTNAGGFTKWQSNASDWSNLHTFTLVTSPSDFASAPRPAGRRPRAYAADGSGIVQVLEKDAADANSDWTLAAPLPTPPSPARSLAVGRLSDGRQQVFALAQNGAVYSSWETYANTDTSPWSGWSYETSGAIDVDVALASDGALQVFVVKTDGTISTRRKVSSSPNSAWGSWSTLASPGGFSRIAAFDTSDGRPQIVAVKAATGSLMTSWFRSPTDGWSAWRGL